MPIFKQTPKSKVVAVIDITSSSVGGALVESNENYPIAISAAPRSPVNFLLTLTLKPLCVAPPTRSALRRKK